MNKPVIMSTRSGIEYARKAVSALIRSFDLDPETSDFTDALTVQSFADGEMEVQLKRSVRGRPVILFANSARNCADLSVEQCKIELYHIIDVLRRSQARDIIVFEPYLSCSRSDHAMKRNSVGLWVHYKTLVSLGTTHLISWQMHSDKSRTIFDPCLCAIDDLPAINLLQKYLCDRFIPDLKTLTGTVRAEWIFCSVDAGGEKLAQRFATSFGTQLMVAHKQRDYSRANTVVSINLLSAVPLTDKSIWIVDDMIDTGGSVYELAKELSVRKVREINILIVHPVFSEPAVSRLSELHQSGILNRLVVCDTIPCQTLRAQLPFLEIIDSSEMCAQVLGAIVSDSQISEIIGSFSPEDYIRKQLF